MRKGYCSTRPSRCRAAHYVDPDKVVSICGRSPIKVTSEGVREMRAEVRRKYQALEVCDFCQTERRKRGKR